MDDELQHLERAHQQDPADLGVARRLKALLLRSGRREDVRLRYELGFVCQVGWDSMARTADPQVRHCGTCRRDVHTATSYAEFEAHAAHGRCVSVEPRRLPLVLDGLIDAPELGLARAAKDPCLVEGDPVPVGPPPIPLRLGGMPMATPARGRTPVPPPVQVEPPPEEKGLLRRFLGLFGG